MITASLHELKIIEQIIFAGKYSVIDFLHYPIMIGNRHRPDGFIFSVGLERKCLGFDDGPKPGDYDLIIIPMKNNNVLVDYTGVLEVKICRPTLENKSRDTNKSGKDQILGLINDDFPFIGLLHIILPQKDTRKEYLFNPYGTEEFSENDTINSIEFEERQLGRLKKLNLPKQIGFCSNCIYDYNTFLSSGMNSSRFCSKRKINKTELSERICYALKNHKDKFYFHDRAEYLKRLKI